MLAPRTTACSPRDWLVVMPPLDPGPRPGSGGRGAFPVADPRLRRRAGEAGGPSSDGRDEAAAVTARGRRPGDGIPPRSTASFATTPDNRHDTRSGEVDRGFTGSRGVVGEEQVANRF